jgi:hypothetical protein
MEGGRKRCSYVAIVGVYHSVSPCRENGKRRPPDMVRSWNEVDIVVVARKVLLSLDVARYCERVD